MVCNLLRKLEYCLPATKYINSRIYNNGNHNAVSDIGSCKQRLLVSILGRQTHWEIISLLLSSGFLFQLVIAGALSSAFIPVFSDYLEKGKRRSIQSWLNTSCFRTCHIFYTGCYSFIFPILFQSFFQVFWTMNLLASLMRIIIIENCFYTEAFRLSFNLITIF